MRLKQTLMPTLQFSRSRCSDSLRHGIAVIDFGWGRSARSRSYTSYDVTYRSRSTTRGGAESYPISGVLNIPKGKGPVPEATS